MRYTIECDGILSGPFATDREAADWALIHCAPRLVFDRSMSCRCSKSDRGKTDGQK
jgi:hypothetical protein